MIQISTYIVSTLFTYFLGIISKKRGWNSTVPIPIQNILIGIIVFLCSIIICKITSQDIIFEDIIAQITASLGGAGTATLYYDSSKRKEN